MLKKRLALIFGILGFSLLCQMSGASSLGNSKPFYFLDLKNLITSKHLTSIEEVMKDLPANFKQNFLLVYHSNSRHRGASFENPRIIMNSGGSGGQGQMIIAVAGSSEQVNGYSLEVIENRGHPSKWQFHQIVFSKNGETPAVLDDSEMCLSCHRGAGPNWEPYPLWPGVYGSGTIRDEEENKLKTFVSQVKASPQSMSRYQSLSLSSDSFTSELNDRNHEFAQVIGTLNAKRIVSAFSKAVQTHPAFKKLLVPMAMLSKDCTQDALSVIPDEFRLALSKSGVPSFESYTQAIKADVQNHSMQSSAIADLLAAGVENQDPASQEFSQTEEAPFLFDVSPFFGIGYLMKYVMGIDPESFTVGVEQTTSHPYGVTSASIYTSQHTLEGIEDQILGYNLTSLSCSQLMSRQLKVP